MKTFKAFTLIELLIVVAIIAILAAIAVPNFLEAQTRAKVSRILNDFRTMKTALESYRVDNNEYPETDLGGLTPEVRGFGPYRLTTPVAFLTSIPLSPFEESELGSAGIPPHAVEQGFPLYIRALVYDDSAGATNFGRDRYDNNYILDRQTYLYQLDRTNVLPSPQILGLTTGGFYQMKSVGPNNIDDRDATTNTTGTAATARVYDPTNGTVSDGDIVSFQDTSVPAQPRDLPF